MPVPGDAIRSFFSKCDDTDLGLVRTTEQAITAPAALAPDFTWDGTTTVLSADTTGVAVGDFIRLGPTGGWFEIIAENANVDVTISNPFGAVIPTGSGAGDSDVVAIPDSVPLSGGLYKIAAMEQPILWRKGDTEFAATPITGSFLGANDQEVVRVDAPGINLRYIVSSGGTADGEINIVRVEIADSPLGDVSNRPQT